MISITPVNAIKFKTMGEKAHSYTALHFCCDGSDVNYRRAAQVRLLSEKRADVDPGDGNGNTPFLLAAGTGLADVCEILIDHGAYIHAEGKEGKGALQRAKGNSTAVREVLLRAGCHMTAAPSAWKQYPNPPSATKQARYCISQSDPRSRWYRHPRWWR